jgi:hypothetical protein
MRVSSAAPKNCCSWTRRLRPEFSHFSLSSFGARLLVLSCFIGQILLPSSPDLPPSFSNEFPSASALRRMAPAYWLRKFEDPKWQSRLITGTPSGATEGIALDIPNLQVGDDLLVTSLVSRSAVHLVTLDLSAHTCQSYALAITRKITEFMFKERGVRGGTSSRSTNATAHNCIIDCHSEVWSSFPCVASCPTRNYPIFQSQEPKNPRIRDGP